MAKVSAMVSVGTLTVFSHEHQEWQLYKERLEQWFLANEIGVEVDRAGAKRRAILLSNCSESTYKLIRNLALPRQIGTLSYDEVSSLLDGHFELKKCTFAERYKFHSATQHVGEGLPEWAARVRGLAAHCGFLAQNIDEQLRDRFVLGMAPGPERDKLFTKAVSELTLSRALEIAEGVRCARMGAQESTRQPDLGIPFQVMKMDATTRGTAARGSSTPAPRHSQEAATPAAGDGGSGCTACGYAGHQASSCRFVRYKCKKCGVQGHLKRMCRQTVNKQHYVECCEDADDDGLDSLQKLTLWNSITSIPPDALAHVPRLRLLVLHNNQLQELPPRLLYNMTHLESVLIRQHLDSPLKLHKHSFANLPSLTNLEICDCISNLPEELFTGCDEIKNLTLTGNNITSLPAGIFKDLKKLEILDLQRNRIAKLDPEVFSPLKQLRRLNLDNNNLEELPDFCQSDNSRLVRDEIKNLTLSGNNITSLPAGIFKDLKKLEILDLQRNRIAKLDPEVFSPLKQLRRLNLDNNNLEELPDHLFAGLTKLEYVSINDNLLQNISSEAFSGAIRLTTVSLKNNRLTLKPQYQLVSGNENFEDYSQFGVLEELQNLYLSGNQISTMFPDWVMVLNKLQKLDLSNNNFTFLEAKDLQFSSPHVEVNLNHNHISSVILPYPPLQIGNPLYKIYNKTTNSVLLDDNPLECDCRLYNLAMRLKGAKSMTVEPKFVIDNAKCASPTHLRGKLFKNWLKMPNDLNCVLPVEKCDQNCLSCQIKTASNELAFHCNNISKNLSEDNYFKKVSKEFGLKDVSLRLNEPPQSLRNLNLKLLNLAGIALKEIPFSPSLNVQTIDFSNNNLTKIPMKFLEANISLYLSNNRFQCDCWNSEEMSYLKSSRNVLDFDLIKCGDQLLKDMEPLDLCLAKWRAAAVAGGIFAVLVLIVAILAVVIYKNSYKIMVFIINRGLCPCCFVDDLDDMNKEFDVFVSYAHKDRKYLETLMPKLENDFGLKTCIHYRDWLVGDFIPDQINRSVEKSKKTIIMLSKNFLDSPYANMEFRAAHNLTLREGKSRIVLILLEDVANHEKLSEDLKSHMKMNTFLKWDDARFTEKLQRAMPLKNNKKFVFPRFFKEAGCKTVKSDVDVHFNNDEELVNVATKDAM